VARILLATVVAIFVSLPASAKELIRLANHPALSPDGKIVAFDWNGDIWTVPIDGGVAKSITTHSAKDSSPKFSPDGKEIAFVSEREGTPQIFVMASTGGAPKQMTFHTAGYTLYEWTPDGKGWLVGTQRDHGWGRRNNDRLQIVKRWDDANKRPADVLIFDDYGQNGTLSAESSLVLFNREGPEWWRKGYSGSQDAQLWAYDRDSKTFTRLATGDNDSRWPMFGKGSKVYYANGQGGCFNIWERDMSIKQNRQITTFKDDSTVFPCISRDASTIVFRNLFDLYRIKPGVDETPVKIEIYRDDDRPGERVVRNVLSTASSAAFTGDGLEIAMVVGGDVWVMDTELREPRRVTRTAEEERQPIFSPDGQSLYFVSDGGGKPEIWKAVRDGRKPWFLTDTFKLERMTDDGEQKSALSFSPDGSKLAYIRGRGDLYVADAAGKNAQRIIQSWNDPQYDWSPDGKWIVYALYDNDFNRDIWIKPLDGGREPFNLSRHPYNESSPVWSPDGKVIAFVGERDSKETTDIHFVFLRAEDSEKSSRDRTIEKALEKMQKGKGPLPKKEPGPMSGDGDAGQPKTEPPEPKKGTGSTTSGKREPVTIDFNGIHERIKRVTIANSNEGNLLWSPDSKKLAFSGQVDGQTGTYTIDIPEGVRPTQITTSTGTNARWLRSGSIAWLSAGRPALVSTTPSSTTTATTPATTTPGTGRGPRGGASAAAGGASTGGGFAFTVYQEVDLGKKHQAAFDVCWRQMRDGWYDDRMNNRDWNKVREKYRDAADTTDPDALTTVVQLMLGELNGSHLGFFAGTQTLPTRRPGGPPEEPSADRNWRPVTAHLGVRFDPDYKGPGLKVRDVLPEGPADQKKSWISPGDIITSIDGTNVDMSMDLTTVLNSPPGKEFRLKVIAEEGGGRDVVVRPTTFAIARQLLYKKWINDNRTAVQKLSNGKLGYLHISAMNMPSFRQFEEDLYHAGVGKDGLVIDVRENGGGSTADLLLTALTQPRHAIAVPRGGGQGYPQDRTVYATWNKPIVVMCNQNSFSNAEIFSHAVKTLKRGRVVGVPTAGGVISTGGTPIMDVGFLRMPFRGWYTINDGEDMERHGAVPDVIVWPQPGDMAKGKDAQIEKAVEVLQADVKAWMERPQPKLLKASERK
jgi:tricorn protease